LAAAVALIAGALVWLRQGASRDAAPAVALPATVQLADLAEPQLERLLAELDQDLRLDSLPRAGGDLDDVTLDDLTADQLQAVLRSMEG
jgi:hypothetical protein